MKKKAAAAFSVLLTFLVIAGYTLFFDYFEWKAPAAGGGLFTLAGSASAAVAALAPAGVGASRGPNVQVAPRTADGPALPASNPAEEAAQAAAITGGGAASPAVAPEVVAAAPKSTAAAQPVEVKSPPGAAGLLMDPGPRPGWLVQELPVEGLPSERLSTDDPVEVSDPALGTCVVPVRRLRAPGSDYCGDAPLFSGMAEGFEACAERCTFESSCRYYSFWLPGQANGGPSDTTWCTVTASCERLLQANSTVVIYQRIVERSARQLWFNFFGMYDSGTNFLLETMVGNFPFCCQLNPEINRAALSASMLPAKRWCVRLMGVFKHTDPRTFLRAALGEQVSNFHAQWTPVLTHKRRIAMVALVRDPLAQLAGWKKAPYKLLDCFRGKCSEDSHGLIQSNCSPPTAWVTQPCKSWKLGEFASIPDVWNSYTSGYLRLQKLGGYNNMKIFRYEDIVVEPKKFVKSLAGLLGVDPPSEVAVVTGPAKKHGQAVRIREAQMKIRQRSFISCFTSLELQAVCSRLDESLLQIFNYSDKECQAPQLFGSRLGVPQGPTCGKFRWNATLRKQATSGSFGGRRRVPK